jgi:hypothetical protein
MVLRLTEHVPAELSCVVFGPRAVALGALAVVAAGSAAVAPGSDRSVETGGQAEIERTVRAAVYAAVRHRNYRPACRFATPRGRPRLLDGFNSSSGPDYPDPPTTIADEVENYPETVRKLRRSPEVDVLLRCPLPSNGPVPSVTLTRARVARTRTADEPPSDGGGGYGGSRKGA